MTLFAITVATVPAHTILRATVQNAASVVPIQSPVAPRHFATPKILMIKPCVPGVRPTTNSGAQRDMTLSFIVNHRIGRIFSKVNRDLFSVVILMLIASAALCYRIIQFYGAEREKVITADRKRPRLNSSH